MNRESNLGWRQPNLADAITEDWNCDANDVVELLNPTTDDPAVQFLASCLSGPIDVDKLDYLQRDSLHAGVPYGRNFDVGRLISSMVLQKETNRLAIGEKGRTAAEMMVFARYVMFSEVYWHHAVRSATAMLQRAVFVLQDCIDLEGSLKLDEPQVDRNAATNRQRIRGRVVGRRIVRSTPQAV